MALPRRRLTPVKGRTSPAPKNKALPRRRAAPINKKAPVANKKAPAAIKPVPVTPSKPKNVKQPTVKSPTLKPPRLTTPGNSQGFQPNKMPTNPNGNPFNPMQQSLFKEFEKSRKEQYDYNQQMFPASESHDRLRDRRNREFKSRQLGLKRQIEQAGRPYNPNDRTRGVSKDGGYNPFAQFPGEMGAIPRTDPNPGNPTPRPKTPRPKYERPKRGLPEGAQQSTNSRGETVFTNLKPRDPNARYKQVIIPGTFNGQQGYYTDSGMHTFVVSPNFANSYPGMFGAYIPENPPRENKGNREMIQNNYAYYAGGGATGRPYDAITRENPNPYSGPEMVQKTLDNYRKNMPTFPNDPRMFF
jgi:hypothetical protein